MTKLTIPFLLLFCSALIFSCKKTNTLPQPVVATDTLYFPPVGSTEWQTTTPASLGWNSNELNNLYSYLDSEHTKAFIILKGGKLVVEKYFGTFTADSLWYWASAGKTLTAFLTGIAQQDGLINLDDKTSKYLGTGWTSEPLDKENLITIKNQLTMTSGLDDGVADPYCTLPSCLVYKADAGTRWAYHTGAYTLLDEVIQNASGHSLQHLFSAKDQGQDWDEWALDKIPKFE